MLVDVYVGVSLHLLYKRGLYLGAGVVGVMQDAELGVAPLTVQVELPVGIPVEFHPVVYEELNLFGGAFHHLLHRPAVGEPVAGDHCVVYVFIEIVKFKISDGGHTSLGEECVRLFQGGLAH